MITSQDFNRIFYRNPQSSLTDKREALSKIIGFDTEAYKDGKPFLFTTSLGDAILPMQAPEIFFEPKYVGANFMIFNIKYDSGALVYSLDAADIKTLWATGEVKTGDYRYTYIAHKQLRIYKGKECVTFWDISQFYKHGGHRLSLDSAAKIYLNEQKRDLRTKSFTPNYVRKYWKSITQYAIQDAVLAGKLGEYLVAKLAEFGITASAIYSCASISFRYFTGHSKVVTAWRWWQEDREFLKFACDAYEGGKFEVTTRGKFTGYEYDLSSAYPREIRDLVDIEKATCYRSKEYQKEAVYGFIRCFINNTSARHLPCGLMRGNVRIYPAGRFYTTITKEEYDYLQTINVEVNIVDAVWLFVKRKRYPYRHVIDTLYNLKTHFKGKDRMLYDVTKIVQNSFYGKTCQAIETPDGKVRIGAGWNPMYASVITANPRIKVTAVQNALQASCLAVHTDSVILSCKLPADFVQDGTLGNFEFVTEGEGVIIASGMYQIGLDCAFKGFKPGHYPHEECGKELKTDTWKSILSRNYRREKISYPVRHVESWIETMAKNHDKSAINVFSKAKKVIDLNCDTKRIWPSRANARSLLSRSEESLHKVVLEKERPNFW